MELPKRKNNRLSGYDYSTANAYFITICTQDRKNLFWQNVGATIGRPQEALLTHSGQIVDHYINLIGSHYPAVTVDQYAIMPNHIHLLIQIHTDDSGRPMAAPTVSVLINQLKGAISKQIGKSIWQKGFYDHIIRDENDYQDAWRYIFGNSMKLAEKHGWDHILYWDE